MSNREIRAGRAHVEVTIRDKMQAGLDAIQARLNSFAGSTARIGGGLVGVAAAGVAPLLASVHAFTERAGDLSDFAARTNASTEALSKLGYAAGQTGGDNAALEASLTKLNIKLTDAKNGSSSAQAALAAVGLQADDIAELDADEKLIAIAKGLEHVAAEDQAAVAMDLLGKSGVKLLPILSGGAAGLEEMLARAKSLGYEMSAADAAAGDQLGDTIDELSGTLSNTAMQIGAALAPALIWLSGLLLEGTRFVMDFVAENRALVVGLAAGLAVIALVGGGFLLLSMLAAGASLAISGVVAALGIIGTLVSAVASPLGIVAALLIGGAAYWALYTESGQAALGFLTSKLGELLAWGRYVFGGIYDAITAGDWGLAAEIMWTALRIAFNTGAGWLTEIWADLKFGFLTAWDLMIVGIRSGWNDAVTMIAKGITWVIEKINAASIALSGVAAIAVDTDAMKQSLEADNARFKKELTAGLIGRMNDRAQARADASAAFDNSALNEELAKLIDDAAVKRAAFEAANQDGPKRLGNVLDAEAGGELANPTTSSSIGTFSAAVAGRLGDTSGIQKEIAANTKKTNEKLGDVQRALEEMGGMAFS